MFGFPAATGAEESVSRATLESSAILVIMVFLPVIYFFVNVLSHALAALGV